jgi:DNA-binding transcriptional ArsR family regulator
LEGGEDRKRRERTAPSPLDDPTAARMAAIFRALADPTRVRIVSALVRGEVCVGDLAACLGMSMSAVSHQLRLLRGMRLVRRRRRGKHVFYSLADEHIYDLFQRGLEHAQHE